MRRSDWMSILILTALACPPARAQPPAYPTETMGCAAQEMQLFYHYLKPDPDPGLKERTLTCSGAKSVVRMPPFLPAALPKMAEHKVWRDPEEGDLSEAQLWQAPPAILYEFLDLAKQAFPKGASAAASAPFNQEKEYHDILLRYKMSLDRIRRSKLEDSLDYRGAALLAAFNRALEPLDAVVDALPAGDGEAFRKAAAAAAGDARDAFALLFAAPPAVTAAAPAYTPKPRVAPGYRGFSLPLPGHQLAFIKPGQWVDVLVTFEALMKSGAKEKVTATILQNVLVIDALRPEQTDGRGALLLMLNPNEAQYAALSVLQGEVRVTARAAGDREMHPMEMASLRKLFK
ncbi:MAG: hypothetical protein PHU21_02175 [Elusimicrobia bacterium]|nr:hypothetical protein [Elusimicrobiota bacterium]